MPFLKGWFTRNQVVESSRLERMRAERLSGLGHLLGEKDRMDVREDAALRDGDAAEELVQLLIVADGELDVPRDDAGLLRSGREV